MKPALGLLFLTLCFGAAGEEELDLLNSLTLDQLLDLEVSTASRINESQAVAAGTLIVIPKAQIEQRRYHDLRDLLKVLPGVEFKNNSVIRYSTVTVRGILGTDKILFLRNGHRLYAPDGQRMPLGLNTSLHHVKQVEVMYGPGSSIYGADAFALVVNIISDDFQQGESTLSLSATKGNQDFEKLALSGTWSPHKEVQIAFASHVHQHTDNALVTDYPEHFLLDDLVTFDGRVFKTAQQRQGPDFPLLSRSYFLEAKLFENLLMTFNHADFIHSTAHAEDPNSVAFGNNPLYYHENQSAKSDLATTDQRQS